MKLLHLSDLHLGLTLNGVSMLEDQTYILKQILDIAEKEQPDVVLIAGDVYDRQIPPAEALRLFDDMLFQLREQGAEVFVIAGNHDSADRLSQYSRLMDPKIHVAPTYAGSIEPTTLKDPWGAVNIYMLPFLKPAHVRRWYPEEEIETYTDAVQIAIHEMGVDPGARNVLVCHQYFTGGNISDSELHAVGGLDNVSTSVLTPFDYAALGHLHSPQAVGVKAEGVEGCGHENSNLEGSSLARYCGTPLAYSFSEAGQQKSITLVELREKGAAPEVRAVPLQPLHQVRRCRGLFDDLMAEEMTEDYLQITLLDEEEIPDVMNRLRRKYPNVMECRYDNRQTAARQKLEGAEEVDHRSPVELFGELFRVQNNRSMTQEQEGFVRELIEKIWEERE